MKAGRTYYYSSLALKEMLKSFSKKENDFRWKSASNKGMKSTKNVKYASKYNRLVFIIINLHKR